jgi:hypothetical protein
MIEAIAWFYVNIIENLGRVIFWGIILILLLALINVLRDPKANLMNSLAKFLLQSTKAILIGSGKALRISIKVLLNAIKVIFAAIRDFWVSKI